MKASAPAILVDADNTLWDTDAVYAAAQVNLLLAVEEQIDLTAPSAKLEFLRAYDQAIADLDHRGFRYPSTLLVRALVLGLRGLGPKEAAAAAPTGSGRTLAPETIDRLSTSFEAALTRMPELLPNVHEGLVHASGAGAEVWVLTENAAELQRSRVAAHGLTGLIKGVAEVTKTRDQFARQRRRFAPRPLVVIGDQPDRDIVPARQAGCMAVLVRSRFRPPTRARADDSDHVAADFLEAMDWALNAGRHLSERRL